MKKTSNLTKLENIDLSNEVALVSPTDTPFTTLLMQNGLVAPANATTITWREKTLDPDRKTPKKEAADASNVTTSQRIEKSNNQQIFERTAEVSGTLQAINVPGIGSEMAQEVYDAMVTAKIDLEYYAIQGTLANETASDPRQMNGIINLINAANKFSPADAGGLITVDDIKKAFRLPWDHGVGGDKIVMVNADTKEYIDKLFKTDEGVTLPALQGGGNIVGLTADRVHTNYGTGNIILNRHIPAETFLVFDLQSFKLRPLRPMQSKRLAENGDYSREMVFGEYSLELKNSYSGSVITGVKGIQA
ncbi:SU10 major capsid protein [Listeria booriae]|uniref:SU10 major capsid protein n=1 Tax=Listeria booriae TaxID=1552123 RepID=UPI00162A3FD5|nr:DUF5309 family protein [Listeria booriae]MBC1524451.1 DUF5309 domain-containing protein [Listeria booriae]MBC6306429.1 DUF5309 domain-containing protein [Listeria booriae]